VPKGSPELGVAEHVLDRGPVPVPVLHRDRPLTGGHVEVGDHSVECSCVAVHRMRVRLEFEQLRMGATGLRRGVLRFLGEQRGAGQLPGEVAGIGTLHHGIETAAGCPTTPSLVLAGVEGLVPIGAHGDLVFPQQAPSRMT
jgi:hypothetical protein